MTDLTERERQIVAWLRNDVEVWKRYGYRTSFWHRAKTAVRVGRTARQRGVSVIGAMFKARRGYAREQAATLDHIATAIERGEPWGEQA